MSEGRLVAIVPAWNESGAIGGVVDEIRAFDARIDVVVVESPEAAVAAYRELVADPAQAEEMGRRARERVLDEHTYAHRARRVLDLLGVSGGAPA